MSVILDSQFATVEDTAAALGVSDARVKRLMRLAGPKVRERRGLTIATNRAEKNGNFKMKTGVPRASRKKLARGKAKKAGH
jgi:hypothetical protein